MAGVRVEFHAAGSFPVGLGAFLKLQRHMAQAVPGQLCPKGGFDLPRVAVRNDMGGGEVVMPVHAPNVKVVNIQNSVDLFDMFPDLCHLDGMRRLFQKQICGFFQIFDCVDQDEEGHADGHDGVNERKVRQAHHDGSG